MASQSSCVSLASLATLAAISARVSLASLASLAAISARVSVATQSPLGPLPTNLVFMSPYRPRSPTRFVRAPVLAAPPCLVSHDASQSGLETPTAEAVGSDSDMAADFFAIRRNAECESAVHG